MRTSETRARRKEPVQALIEFFRFGAVARVKGNIVMSSMGRAGDQNTLHAPKLVLQTCETIDLKSRLNQAVSVFLEPRGRALSSMEQAGGQGRGGGLSG